MPTFKRRTRIVLFRLTDDEYEALQSACAKRGARTISDFARKELLRSVAREREEMTEKLSEIACGVERLEKLITGIAKAETDL
jgi:DNA-binding transcriptional regulator GbsR (MarR family)